MQPDVVARWPDWGPQLLPERKLARLCARLCAYPWLCAYFVARLPGSEVYESADSRPPLAALQIVGAKGTVYEGEIYRIRVRFHADYPTAPPEVCYEYSGA